MDLWNLEILYEDNHLLAVNKPAGRGGRGLKTKAFTANGRRRPQTFLRRSRKQHSFLSAKVCGGLR